MSKMTDNHIADDGKKVEEVIKALEFCSHCVCDDDKTETKCPYYNMPFCKNYLRKQSLDVINRQQAEIERLNTLCQEQNSEIKRLIETKNRLLYNLKSVCEEKDEEKIKVEAIKEYKEKLREHAYLDSGITGFQKVVVDLSDIENIADEMVGEGK